MITFDQFMARYSGQKIDFDGVYGYQCVDLVNQYNKEVIGGSSIHGNAIDFKDTFPHDLYDWIGRTPGSVPAKGDIVVWGAGLGAGNGHVAVFEHGDANNFTSFDQNYPYNYPCHHQPHDYGVGPVLGWLHPKGGGGGGSSPGIPASTLLQTALATVPQTTWMPIFQGAALWKFAHDNNLQDQLTPERPFIFNYATYIAQAFFNGIAYCQVGHYAPGEIKSVPRSMIASVADPLARAAVGAVPSASWMVVSHDFWLWKFANAHQLQDQQTEEKPFTYQGQPWRVQVFQKGIVYCPVDHYNNAETQLYPKLS